MTVLLLGVIAVLVCIVAVLAQRGMKRRKQLAYIHNKLSEWNAGQTSEQVLLFTADHELQRLLIELNRLINNNRREAAAYAKTEQSMRKMLTNMSHDLKTPLTVVLGLTETIATDQSISEQERGRLLTKVHAKALEVVALLNKFFDLAKLESEDRHIPLSKINLNLLCQNIILFFYEQISAKGLEVDIEIPSHDVYAFANSEAIERICGNLLSNAIRYGSEGNVIGISLRSDDKSVYIEVWDRGRGISETDQQHIFERLYTLDDSRNKRYQGSGLGLTISKRLTQKLGGSLTVQSVPYEKTVFTLQLSKISY